MGKQRGDPPAVRVYTVCDESKYLIVRNVPALGCGEQLHDLFNNYGHVEECKPMDAEDCEPFTDVYWIKFAHVNNARFAKRKLDESVFLGNRLQVSYAPQFESVSDTKEKLEGRRNEVLGRMKAGRTIGSKSENSRDHQCTDSSGQDHLKQLAPVSDRAHLKLGQPSGNFHAFTSHVSSNKEYFTLPSMNQTVQVVREKLDKIQSSCDVAGPVMKKLRADNRRRI